MKYAFRKIKLSKENKKRLDLINEIIEEYREQGYVLTLRQLYYQLVSRDVVPNIASEYAKLSNLLKEGRMGGVVDWDAIEDRLRKPSKPGSWESAKDILQSAAYSFEMPRLKGQKNYIEVWVEKDALSGVLSRVTSVYHVPILVNRGYSSASAMFDSFNRFNRALQQKQNVTVLYLGDYDPSGIDMIRDIRTRSLEFMFGSEELLELADNETGGMQDYEDMTEEEQYEWSRLYEKYFESDECAIGPPEDRFLSVKRAWVFDRFNVVPIALTKEQIAEYNPPPNPAKKTDPRSVGFIKKHGSQSWEVDALRPEVLHELLESEIIKRLDMELYKDILEKEKVQVKRLEGIIKRWKD